MDSNWFAKVPRHLIGLSVCLSVDALRKAPGAIPASRWTELDGLMCLLLFAFRKQSSPRPYEEHPGCYPSPGASHFRQLLGRVLSWTQLATLTCLRQGRTPSKSLSEAVLSIACTIDAAETT